MPHLSLNRHDRRYEQALRRKAEEKAKEDLDSAYERIALQLKTLLSIPAEELRSSSKIAALNYFQHLFEILKEN